MIIEIVKRIVKAKDVRIGDGITRAIFGVIEDEFFKKKKIMEEASKDVVLGLMRAISDAKSFNIFGLLSKFKNEKSEEVQKEVAELTTIVMNYSMLAIIMQRDIMWANNQEMLLSVLDKPSIEKMLAGGVFEMHRMTTREKAVVIQMMLSRNITIEKWDGHRMTLKLIGLKGGMMNTDAVIV